MKKLLPVTMLGIMLAVVCTEPAQAGRQAVCHFPPGNPANFHTIVVSDNAVPQHVERHRDIVGSCFANCETICDDSEFCTQDVVSDPDLCICQADPRPSLDCDDSNECTADSCDSGIGACLYNADIMDGEPCDDGDPATLDTVCSGGDCVLAAGCAAGDRYENLGDGTVKDCDTNLIWLQDASCLGSGVWDSAQEIVADLNDTGIGSDFGCAGYTEETHTNWRLPTKEEWETTIADARNLHNCIHMQNGPPSLTNDSGDDCQAVGPSSFVGVQARSSYWSATNVDAHSAWVADLDTGWVHSQAKTAASFVWPVRGGQ